MTKRQIIRLIASVMALMLFASSALAAGYTTLRYRDEGDAVRQMQTALNSLGYSTGGADGKFGPTTEKAVRQFQRSNSLKVDGVAGNATLTRLYALADGSGSSSSSGGSSGGGSSSGSTKGLFGGNYAKLEYGSQGDRVKLLQQALSDLGFFLGTVDGRFGTATQKAVVDFQQANALDADGKAGPKTLQKIEQLLDGDTDAPTPAPTAAPGGTPSRTLRKGSQGEDVKTVQTRLKELGYYTGSVDGKYGTGTIAAVTAFQTQNGLSADGVAGSGTYKVLFSNSAKPAASAPTATPSPTPSPTPGYYVPTRTLRDGDSGEDVKSVQNRLKALGYYTGTVDGKYGTGTIAAVTAFQTQNGLTSDGVAGSGTYKVLFSDSAKPAGSTPTATPTPSPTPSLTPAYQVPSRTLRDGDSGEDVKSVQTRLKALGYYTGTVDGKYGTGTIAAVTAFQTQNGLTADGVAGSGTYKVLFSDSAKPAPSSPTPAPTATPDPSTFTNLKKGSTGEAVQRLQAALASLGYTVNTDGTYTNATVTAVKQFQQQNGLSADGIAGPTTQKLLYSGSAKGPSESTMPDLPDGAGTGVTPPPKSEIQLLHWFNDIKPTLKSKAKFLVYDPATGLSWTLQLLSPGRHADSEPLTATDTAVMFKAFGNQNTWNQKAVYVRLPDGRWTIGSTHDMPHLSGNIKDNNFDGHLCLHFLRDMSEAEKNDPNYGVANQKTIRQLWKSLTGQDIAYK